MASKFEVYKDVRGKWRFRLKAWNGEIIAAASEEYETKQGCIKGIHSVKKNAERAPIVVIEEEPVAEQQELELQESTEA